MYPHHFNQYIYSSLKTQIRTIKKLITPPTIVPRTLAKTASIRHICLKKTVMPKSQKLAMMAVMFAFKNILISFCGFAFGRDF